jgi:hypothetical protein
MGSILTISKENQYGARLRLLIRWTVQVYRQERWFSGAAVGVLVWSKLSCTISSTSSFELELFMKTVVALEML